MRNAWLRLAGALLCGLCAVCLLSIALSRPRPIQVAAQAELADGLLISAVHVGLPRWGGEDEAFQLANSSDAPILLTGTLQVVNQAGEEWVLPGGHVLEPGARIWCARNALSFTLAFGFSPTLEYGQFSPSFVLPDRRGSLTLLRLERVDVANPTGGPWPAGSNEDKSSMERRDPTLDGGVGNWANSTSTTVGLDKAGGAIVGTPRHTNSTYLPAQPVESPAVAINEIAWAGTLARYDDEWIELYNNTDRDIRLDGWLLEADDRTPSIRLVGMIGARGFFLLERTADDAVSNVAADQVYAGSLRNTGEALSLYRAEVLDAVAYGPVDETPAGWTGPPLEFYNNGSFSREGQILFRRQDAVTGELWPDTDSAVDWANASTSARPLYGTVDEGDLYGKRVMYPGWEILAAQTPAPVVPSAMVTVAVAPDNAYAVLAGLLGEAQHEILVGAYSFDSVWLTGVLTERIQAGVQVTMLLEGGPVGGLSEATLWNCAQVAAAGGRVYFAHHDPTAGIYGRYRNHHAKYLVVDGRWLAVGSENFGNHALPVDDKSNGTAGDRGVFLVIDQRQAAEAQRALFARDCDPTRYLDLVAYGEIPRYVVPPTYTAVYSTGGGGYEYMAPFSVTLPGWAADRVQVQVLPQASMSTERALLGLVLQAGPGDRVDVEQMNEALHWGAADSNADVDPNPRLEAYIQAARNGAQVRILLDSGLDDEGRNRDTAFHLIALAEAEELDLEVRLGNPTGRGIHNKMVLVDRGLGEQCVHVGSINGSEASNKINREVAVQFCSPGAHAYLTQVFEYDWAHSVGVYDVWLPLIYREAVRESDHVVISEVVFKLTGSEQGEWIELYNPTARAVDLSGWQLGDAVHRDDYERRYAFPEGTVISPSGTLVVARQAVAYRSLGYETQAAADLEWHRSDDTPNMIRTAWGEDEFLLGNEGDEVLLVDLDHRIVDVVVYGSGVYGSVVPFVDLDAVYNGNSLERWPANWDSDDCVRDFRVHYVPAPGAVNHR